jgi:hypothetical protein
MDILGRKILATLTKLEGCAIGAITAETNVALTGGKKNPMQGKVTKIAENCNVMFFCNSKSNGYNNMVKRRLVSEGKDPETFVLGKRAWGERVPETPFIEHKDQLYVEVIFLKAPKCVKYFLDGVQIAKDAIVGLATEKEEGVQGGLDNKVIIRSYKLSSIKEIKMGEFSVA